MMISTKLIFFTIAAVIHTFMFTYSKKLWTNPPMTYLDEDLFFDRIVFPIINIKNYTGDGAEQKIISTGVLISEDRLLTSYNPFRDLVTSTEMLSNTVVCYLKGRNISDSSSYDYVCEQLKGGRPLVPMDDKVITNEQWHGPDKKHSPLHDLMILRLAKPLELWAAGNGSSTYEDDENNKFSYAGPSLTELAKADDNIDKAAKFVALGLKTRKNAKTFFELDVVYYSHADFEEAIIDCDSWFSRKWGYFICIKNEFTAGFGSGALLFSNDKLFGVGSFTIWREKESVLVFTDVRPYNDLINNTCTDYDFNLDEYRRS